LGSRSARLAPTFWNSFQPQLDQALLQRAGEMHSFWVRANAVFFFGLAVLAGLATLNVLSTWTLPDTAPDVNAFKVFQLRRLYNKGNRNVAVLSFELDVDLEPVWTWNTKQIFAFVVAEYSGNVNKANGVVLFDKIIKTKDSTRIHGKDIAKYQLLDFDEDLRDVSISLKLAYDIHPIFGPLQLFGTGRRSITFPDINIGQLNYTFPTVYS